MNYILRRGGWGAIAGLMLPGVLLSQRFSDLPLGHLPAEAAFATCCAAMDVEGDFDVDLIFPSANGYAQLYRNLGGRKFAFEVIQIPVAGQQDVIAVAAFDYDGDGDDDLMIGRPSQRPMLWRNNQGSFVDVTSSTMPNFTGAVYPSRIIIGDVDGDGRPDAFFTGSSLLLMLQTAAGTYVVANDRLPPYPFYFGSGILADVDGDGDLDFAAPSRGSGVGPHHCWINNGSGYFTDESSARMPAAARGGGMPMAAGDIDGDGDVDLVATQAATDIYIYRNNGSGSFLDHDVIDFSAFTIPGMSAYLESLDLADLDQDGDLDMVATDAQGGRHLYLNGGGGEFTRAASEAMPQSREQCLNQVVVDIDLDGDLDVVQAVYGSTPHRILCNDGNAHFVQLGRSAIGSTLDQVQCALAMDFDGDGLIDMVRASTGGIPGGFVNSFRNQGDGTFLLTEMLILTNSRRPVAMAAGDVDGDGVEELYVSSDDGKGRLLRNQGDGRFEVVREDSSVLGWVRLAAFADFDGDGDVDLVLTRQTGTLDSGFAVGTELLMNDGLGLFDDVTSTHMPVVSSVSQCIAILDAEGDGDLDVFLGLQGTPGASNVLLINDGEGVFVVDTTRTPSGLASNVYTVEAADINGDGRVDLLADDRLWLGSASGQFVDATVAMGLIHPKEPMYVGDFDGDGLTDLFRNSPPLSVYRNSGAGFQLISSVSPTPYIAQAKPRFGIAADFDLDGDLDVGFGWSGIGNVQWNLLRHLHVPLVPAPGMSLPIEVHAARRVAGAPTLAVLVIGIGRERSETPWGVAWIDQAGPMGLHVMSVPWNTPATASLPIPPWLSLQGTELTFQALMLEGDGASPRLSNAITTTIR